MSSSNIRWFFVVVIAALIVSVTWWKISSRPPEVVSPVANDLPADSGPLPARRFAAHPVLSASASPEEMSRFNKAKHEQSLVKKQKLVESGRNKLVTRYQSEKVDGGWATGREQSLIEHSVSPQIHEMGADPKNLTAHCRSTTCQLTADFPTRNAADDWFTLYLTNTGTDLFNASYQTTLNPDGTTHVEIYGLAKKP